MRIYACFLNMTSSAVRAKSVAVAFKRERHYAPSGRIGRVLARAAKLKAQIDNLQSQLDQEREFLLEFMTSQKLDVIYGQDFRCQLKTRHNWTYSPETERELLKLRGMKSLDIAQGRAVDAPTVHVALSTFPGA